MQLQWYPIQIDIPSAKGINPNHLQDHKLCCTFLAKQPQDSNKSDEHS